MFPNLYYKERSYDFVTKRISSGKIFKIYYTDDKYSKFASKKLCVYHNSPCIQNKSITNQFEVKQINGYLVLKLNKIKINFMKCLSCKKNTLTKFLDFKKNSFS